jgi:hypothetical protein
MKTVLGVVLISLASFPSAYAADTQPIRCEERLSPSQRARQSTDTASKEMRRVERIHVWNPLPHDGTPYQYIEMLPENMKPNRHERLCAVDKSLNEQLFLVCDLIAICAISGSDASRAEPTDCVVFKKMDKSYR